MSSDISSARDSSARADHAPLAGGDVLVGVERKDGYGVQGADAPAFVFGARGVGSVLDDGQAVFPGQGEDRVHVAGLAGKVHRDDCPGMGRNLFPDLCRIDVECAGLDVRQDRRGAAEDDHADRGGEGHGGGDDLVPLFYSEGQEGQVQAGGGGTQGDGIGRPHIGLEGILEQFDLGAGGDPAGFQGVNDLVDLVVVDGGGGEGEKGFAHVVENSLKFYFFATYFGS